MAFGAMVVDGQIEIFAVLEQLAKVRPLFHSEADFQHALAWQLQKQYPEAQIRLEVPLSGLEGRPALDLVARSKGQVIAFELKYFKGTLSYDHDGERFALPATGARDIARHDVCKDIVRIEHSIGTRQATEGYVIVLSNDPGFWNASPNVGIDEAFKIHHGSAIAGTLAWSDLAGSGTRKGRDVPLTIQGEYELRWWPYSHLGVRNGEFKCLVIPVFSGIKKPKQALPEGQNGLNRAAVQPKPASSDAMRTFFASQLEPVITMTFEEFAALRGGLPPSAYNHSAWWSSVSSHPHAIWELEGYFASPKLGERTVIFRRKR